MHSKSNLTNLKNALIPFKKDSINLINNQMDSNSTNIAFIIGYNSGYRFGLNHQENIKTLTNWNDINKLSIKSIHLSASGLIIHTTNNKYFSMGKNDYGQCAINSQLSHIKQPSIINYFTQNNIKIKEIYTTVTGYCTFWKTTDNKIYANGKNDRYELGIKTRQNQIIPTFIKSLENISKICCCGNYSVALDSNGKVFTTERFKNDWRMKTSFKEPVINISTGGTHILYELASGIIYAYGDNKYGQLGTFDIHKRMNKLTYFHDNDIKITKISSGWNHNLLLDCNMNVWSWGRNDKYQCGMFGDNIIGPTVIQSVINVLVIDIKCGYRHSYICSDNKEHMLFGNNKYNECSLINNGDEYVKIPMSINNIIYKKTNGKIIKNVYVGNDNTIVLVEDNGKENNNYEFEFKEEKKDSHITLNRFLNQKQNGNDNISYESSSESESDSDSLSDGDDDDIPPGVTKGKYNYRNNKKINKQFKLTPESQQLLEIEINKQFNINKHLENQLNDKSEQFNILENKYKSIKKKLKLKEGNNNNNNENIIHENKFNELNKKCIELEMKFKNTNEKYDILENKYNLLQNELAEINEKFNKKNNKYNELKKENLQKKNEINKLDNELAEMNEIIGKNNKIKEDYDLLQDKYNNIENECDSWKNKSNSNERQMLKMHKQLKEIKNENKEIENKNKEMKEEMDIMRTELKNKTETNLLYVNATPPKVFLCPISFEVMIDAVLAADGHTYERNQILNWFKEKGKPISPFSNEVMENKRLIKNRALRDLIDQWKKTQKNHENDENEIEKQNDD